MPDIISAWRNFDHEKRPYLLEGDEIPQSLVRHNDGWEGFIKDPDFGASNDNKLHVDLLPIPFIGNLSSLLKKGDFPNHAETDSKTCAPYRLPSTLITIGMSAFGKVSAYFLSDIAGRALQANGK